MNDFEKGQALSKKLLDGINKLADPVASTLGAKGRNVLLACKGCGDDPIVTKDGVTVANAINLEDAFEDMGAQIAKQAAKATHESAGDGTTTATVLTRAMFKNAQKYIASGASPVEVKRGMDKATQAIVSRLVSLSQPISSAEDIEHIARISANNDKAIGKLIATAIDQAGKDIGDTLTISAITLPAGSKATIDRDFVIANISAPSGLKSAGIDDDEPEEEEGADEE